MQNTKLRSDKIIDTVGLLKKRIEERFPGSGLGRVCSDLEQIAKEADVRVKEIQQDRIGYRLVVFLFVAAVLVFSAVALTKMDISIRTITVAHMLEILDALFNIVFLIGCHQFSKELLDTCEIIFNMGQ